MIQAVLFDLDGTLLDRDTSIQQFVAAQYERLITHLNHIPQSDYVSRFIELDCRGHVWKDKVYQKIVTEFEIRRLSWQALLQDYETQFQDYCVPFPSLVEVLSGLKQQGYSLGIVSNGLGTFQTRAIKGLGIQDYFEVILISEIEQMRKPQAEIFHRAAKRLGVTAKNSVFIGDHPEADIMGAKNAEMKAIWKRSSYWQEAKEADAIIDELSEIPSILEQFESNCQPANDAHAPDR
ncbi:HAD-IA family hydrolase [Microcoleus sp. FACHB-1515]|uniref:HAD family hydrolase n=1 Tax=Cyanophyceae TaxID=3028117 RepID=UPI0016860D0B|nr:HAD family hydrolase [Microcoleus sp. FACHB-1515]MBD2092769.1 HAD-IA family hydrolase [Microcoleus sp. FACHB-1515]